MGRNRPVEITAIPLRIKQIEDAMATIHNALQAALTNTANIRNDPRSRARLGIYQLIAAPLNKEILISFDIRQISKDDLDTYFKQLINALANFYKSTDESDALTNADMEFFHFTITIFKAMTSAHFYYKKLIDHLERFTPTHQHFKLQQFDDATWKVQQIHQTISVLQGLDTDIDTRRKHLIMLEVRLQAMLDTDYKSRHNTITEEFNLLARQLNDLALEFRELATHKQAIKDTQTKEDYAHVEREIAAYNAHVATFIEKLTNYRHAHRQLVTMSHTLYDEVKGQIDLYDQAAIRLNNLIQKRNTQLEDAQNNIKRVGSHLTSITKDINHVNALRDNIATPLDAIFSVPHSTPEAYCTKLKLNGLFNGKHDTEWTTLGKTITEQLQAIQKYVELPCINIFTEPMQKLKTQGKELLNVLRPYYPLAKENTITEYANQLLENNDKALERQHDAVTREFKQIKQPRQMIYKRIRVHKKEDATKPARSFLSRHWKALAGGLLLGAGLAVATVLTAGIVPLTAGIATTLAVAASTLAGGTAGTLTSAMACSIHDYCHSKYQIRVHDDQPDDSARSPSPPAPPAYARLVFKRSPAAIKASEAARHHGRRVDFSADRDGYTGRLFAPVSGGDVPAANNHIVYR